MTGLTSVLAHPPPPPPNSSYVCLHALCHQTTRAPLTIYVRIQIKDDHLETIY